jgi:hypothetical protein
LYAYSEPSVQGFAAFALAPWHLELLGGVGRKKVQPDSAGAEDNSEEEDSDEEVEEDGDDDIEDLAANTFGKDLDLAATTIASAALDAHRYSGICEEHDAAVAELHDIENLTSASPLLPDCDTHRQPSPLYPTSNVVGITEFKSQILDSVRKLSISKMLEARAQHQSSTTTRSERVVKLSPKFTTFSWPRTPAMNLEKRHQNVNSGGFSPNTNCARAGWQC